MASWRGWISCLRKERQRGTRRNYRRGLNRDSYDSLNVILMICKKLSLDLLHLGPVEHTEQVVHPRPHIVAPHESTVARIVDIKELLDFRLEQRPQIIDIGQISQQIRATSKQSHLNPNLPQVPDRRVGLPIMRTIVLSRAIVESLELLGVENLFPVLHVEDTGACRIMAH